MRGHGFLQRVERAGVPRRIRGGAELAHALRATQLLELQRLVLHRQFVPPLPAAVEPLEEFRGEAEGAAQ